MRVVARVAEVREAVAEARAAGHRIGFVPTMGYLHAGHLRLVEEARRRTTWVVLSNFVNPLQFGRGEDYERYPRDLDRDNAMAAAAGVDLVFAPSVEEMYPEPERTFVEVEGLSDTLCGASRPGHFRGVATVVAKLLHVVLPDVAFFGQKDAQQLAVIRRMVRDLFFPVEVVAVATVRDADGLALSSRNTYLSPEQRRSALALYRSLCRGEELLRQGERSPQAVLAAMRRELEATPDVRVDYVAAVDPDSLEPLANLQGRVLLAVAAHVGPARLIDNFLLEVSDDRVAHAV
ncbi:MAG: pantoate--beta-alanine ligase [Clostridia bacterium]|nr:pantoate--beta-alanine ligase [Clostridia bacterium]